MTDEEKTKVVDLAEYRKKRELKEQVEQLEGDFFHWFDEFLFQLVDDEESPDLSFDDEETTDKVFIKDLEKTSYDLKIDKLREIIEKEEKTKIDLYGDGIGSVELVQSMGTDLTVVNAARVSFNVEKSVMDHKDEKLIDYLIKHRHTSTLEHNFATFRFKVPLFVRSQHHRHRTWSYNEISRRYTESDIEFYEPKIYRSQHKSNRQASTTEEQNDPLISIYPDTKDENEAGIHLASDIVARHHKRSLVLFEALLKAGVCREQARGVLPQNLYTQYYGTCNLNNLLKFIELRIHMGAQWEIQEVAKACLKIAEDIWPVAVGAYRELRGLPEMEVE